MVVSGSADCTVRLWQLSQGKSLWIANGHKTAIQCVDCNHNVVLSAAADGEVRVWDVITGHLCRLIQQVGDRILCGC